MTDRERKIQEKIAQIKRSRGDYWKIHEEEKRKRLDWLEKNRDNIQLTGSLPRQAYTVVLFEYMGIGPDKAPVIYEDERKITWRSFNFCSILEACQRLELDTRVVCKEGYEESVEDLISYLSPNLRFSRNYEEIRPYERYCEESIDLVVDPDIESKPIRGPCPFFRAKGLFSCDVGGEPCEGDDNLECGRYWILGGKLIDRVRAKCACQRVEFNGKWFKGWRKIIIPGTDIPIPLAIWRKSWDSLPNVLCRKCRAKKEEK